MLITKLVKLSPHFFIVKQQSHICRNCKQFLENGTVICLMDISKKYTFHVQNEAQGYHWTHNNCPVHPLLHYYSINGDLQH